MNFIQISRTLVPSSPDEELYSPVNLDYVKVISKKSQKKVAPGVFIINFLMEGDKEHVWEFDTSETRDEVFTLLTKDFPILNRVEP